MHVALVRSNTCSLLLWFIAVVIACSARDCMLLGIMSHNILASSSLMDDTIVWHHLYGCLDSNLEQYMLTFIQERMLTHSTLLLIQELLLQKSM